MEKEKNLQESDESWKNIFTRQATSIDEIEKLHLSDVMKSVLLEMNELYWEYANYNPKHESHAFRVAEGIKLCMDCVKKHFS